MSWFEDSDIKKSYIVQTVSDVGIFSACTQIYLTNILPCAGDTINITGNLGVSGNISGTTYYGDGSQLSGIVTTDNYVTGGVYSSSTETLYFTGTTGFTPFSVDVSALLDDTNSYVTGGTYNPTTDIVTLTRNDNVSINITGVSNTFTTGATYDEGTELITFVRNDGNTYTTDLSSALSGKVDTTLFDNYTGATQTILDNKLETASNVGGGEGLFSGKSGTDLKFRTISGGTNVTASTVGDIIKIDVTTTTDSNTFVTGGTHNLTTNVITLNRNDGQSIEFTGFTDSLLRQSSGVSDVFTTGATYNNENSIVTFTKNNGETFPLDLSSLESKTSNDVYDSSYSVPTVKTVGGISSGTAIGDLTGKTISEILDLMLFPTQTPSSSNPSTSLTLSGLGSIYQIGQEFPITFNTSASGGGWSPSTYPGGVTQPSKYAGNVTNAVINYAGDGSSTIDGYNLTISGDYDIENPTDNNYKVVAGNNRWTLTTTFAAGEDAFDSKGNPIVGSGYAGGVLSGADSFQGTYPIYVINEDSSFRTLPLMSLTTSTIYIEIDFEGTATGAPTFEFRIPKAFGTPTEIYQKDFNGNWGDVNLLNNRWQLSSLIRNTDYDTNVDYWRFQWDDSQGKIGAAEFKITI
jgi:hypothetical protein